MTRHDVLLYFLLWRNVCRLFAQFWMWLFVRLRIFCTLCGFFKRCAAFVYVYGIWFCARCAAFAYIYGFCTCCVSFAYVYDFCLHDVQCGKYQGIRPWGFCWFLLSVQMLVIRGQSWGILSWGFRRFIFSARAACDYWTVLRDPILRVPSLSFVRISCSWFTVQIPRRFLC